MVYMTKRIGRAEGSPTGADNRVAVYNVFAESEDGTKLTVEYAGHRVGTTTWGVPMGGPGWTPPTRFDVNREWMTMVEIFPVSVSR